MQYPAVNIEIGISKMLTGEIGVIAARELKKATVIAPASEFKEKLLPWDIFDALDQITQKRIMAYCLGSVEGFYAPDDLNFISIPWHMNHSCAGNVGFNKYGDFITIRAIENAEELTWDYGLAETNPNFRMNCKCSDKNCRKFVTGNDWKDVSFREKNRQYMHPSLPRLK